MEAGRAPPGTGHRAQTEKAHAARSPLTLSLTNGRRGAPRSARETKQPPRFKSPQRHFERGKAGAFSAQNLLGKSAWTTPPPLGHRGSGPELKLHQCGPCPKKMALRALQSRFIYHKARSPGPLHHHQASQGKMVSEQQEAVVWGQSSKTSSANIRLMLNRALRRCTRLGIQGVRTGFLVEGKANSHPSASFAHRVFNADLRRRPDGRAHPAFRRNHKSKRPCSC